MRAGDLVRFKQCLFHGTPKVYSEWKVGLLLEYHTWEKVAKILYNGQIVRVGASDTQIHKRAKRQAQN